MAIPNNLLAKADRAFLLINDLQGEWDDFRAKDGYRIGFKDDPVSGDRTHYIQDHRPIPIDIPLIAGDAIHNLRSSLDHLAHHLVCKGTGQPGPFIDVYFPIGKDQSQFEEKLTATVGGKGKPSAQRLPQDAIKAIKEIEPYEYGQGARFWHLHWLNNLDKHRMLITAGGVNSAFSMLPSERAHLRKNFLGMEGIEPSRDKFVFMSAQDEPIFPLQIGSVLRVTPREEIEDDPFFPIQLAFGEPAALESYPVITILHQMLERILHIFHKFDDLGLL